MSTPEVTLRTVLRNSSLAIIAAGIAGLVIGAGIIYLKSITAETDDTSGEPPSVTYVVRLREAQLINKEPATRAGFVAALKHEKGKAVFRHNTVILEEDASGNLECDTTSLKNAGLYKPNPPPPDPCKDLGQQVTQRIGFQNRENLNKALAYLADAPEP